MVIFSSNPASGRTSVNRGNIEKQVPRPSEEGHGARSGESDVGRCGQAACVVTAVDCFTAVGACLVLLSCLINLITWI